MHATVTFKCPVSTSQVFISRANPLCKCRGLERVIALCRQNVLCRSRLKLLIVNDIPHPATVSQQWYCMQLETGYGRGSLTGSHLIFNRDSIKYIPIQIRYLGKIGERTPHKSGYIQETKRMPHIRKMRFGGNSAPLT